MRKLLKWLAIVAGALVVVLLVVAVAIYFASEAKMNRRHTAPTPAIVAASDAVALERGKHLVTVVSTCVDCHGSNLGGNIIFDDPALGRIVAPNLTTGKNGLGKQLSDTDIARVLRYGVLPDGRSVRVMPSDDFTKFSDADLAAVIAYVRTMPPVDSDLPASMLKPVGRALLTFGQLPIMIADRIDQSAIAPATMAEAPTAEYGHYLANVAGCTGCHGPGLSGGLIPGAPPDFPQAANLTPSGEVGQWTEADFIRTIRTGINPAGKILNPEMPWAYFAQMSDTELKALWAFVHAVPSKPAGTR